MGPLKFTALTLVLLISCSPVEADKSKEHKDSTPPVVQEIVSRSQNLITLSFDKEVTADSESFVLVSASEEEDEAAGVAIETIENCGKSVLVVPQEQLKAGAEYFIKGTVSDADDNSTSLGVAFFGYNPDVPSLVINEFTSNGSDKHTDMVELYAKTSGNIAGVTLFAGTKSSFTDKLVLPEHRVKAGDYIVIHFKSNSLESHKTGLDFLVADGTGLSGNNGAITIYSNPYGELLDAVLYTNRSSDSDENYRGFGSSKFMLQADEIYEAGGWQIDGEEIAPEDCVPSGDSTATRSVCRSKASEDTNSKGDWHTVPTSKFSFGKVNSDEVYVKS